MELVIKGITIHNTGNDLSAQENVELIGNKKYLCHYFVDENEVINNYPLTEVSFHTGKGYDWGNLHTISIEICRSRDERYAMAEENAIGLIRELMEEYHLTRDDIFFHNDFDKEAVCPHRILAEYSKAEWIQEKIGG